MMIDNSWNNNVETKKCSADHVLEMFIWSVGHPIEFFNFSVELFQLDNSPGMLDKILFVKYRHYPWWIAHFGAISVGQLRDLL